VIAALLARNPWSLRPLAEQLRPPSHMHSRGNRPSSTTWIASSPSWTTTLTRPIAERPVLFRQQHPGFSPALGASGGALPGFKYADSDAEYSLFPCRSLACYRRLRLRIARRLEPFRGGLFPRIRTLPPVPSAFVAAARLGLVLRTRRPGLPVITGFGVSPAWRHQIGSPPEGGQQRTGSR